MYEVGSGKANTGLYNVGKGGAQVFDTSIVERAIVRKEDKVAAKKVAKAKTDAATRKRATDLMGKKIGQVHPADVDAFKQRSLDYGNAVREAFKGGDISIEKEVELNQMYATLQQNSLASKARFDTEKAKMATIFGDDSYDDRSRTRSSENFAASSFGEDGVFDPSDRINAVARFDFGERVGKMSADRAQLVERNKKDGKTDWTLEQAANDARHLIDDDRSRREFHEMLIDLDEEGEFDALIQDVYTSEFDEAGNANPSYSPDGVPDGVTVDNVNMEDVLAYKYQKEFFIEGRGVKPKGDGGSDKGAPITYIDPETGLMTTYTGDKSETALFSNVPYKGNPTLATPPYDIKFNPETGVLESGKMTIKPSTEQSKANTKIRSDNSSNEAAFTKALATRGWHLPVKMPTDFWGKDQEPEFKKKVAKREEDVAELRKLYPIKKEKDPERIVDLTPAEVRQFYAQTWGVAVEDVWRDQGKTKGQRVVVETAVTEEIDYSNIEEASIAKAMKGNPGKSRASVIKALSGAKIIR